MKRIGKLVLATVQVTRHPAYQHDLQTLWAARWQRLSNDGQARWLRHHAKVLAKAWAQLPPVPMLRAVSGLTAKGRPLESRRRPR